MPTRLVIYRDNTVERVDLTKPDVRIGRAPENDVVVEDLDKTVSRFHAELRREQENYVIIDLNSQNGVWVDGQRVHRASLEPGRSVVLGKVRLELEPSDLPAAERPAIDGLEARTELAPKRRAVVAPFSLSRLSRHAAAASAASSRAGAAQRARLVSTLAKPRALAGMLGIVVLAVVLRLMFASPSSEIRDQDSGVGIQDSGIGKQETGNRKRETGHRNQETGDRKQDSGNRKQETGVGPPGKPGVEASPQSGEQDQKPAPAEPAPRTARTITQAKLLIARSDYAAAVELLDPLMRTSPSAQVAQLLEQARQLRGQRVGVLMREGARLEHAGSLAEAHQHYLDAQKLHPAQDGLADTIARVEAKLRTAGEDAYKRARQYDALGRTKDAVPLYEQALRLLPDGNPSRAMAAERLAALKGSQP